MDPNETYTLWVRALLEEDADAAREFHGYLKTWLERGGFPPRAFETSPFARRQFDQFNYSTGRIGL